MVRTSSWWRYAVVISMSAVIIAPLAIVLKQSFLDAPFFMRDAQPSLEAYGFVLTDPEFWWSAANTIMIAAMMTIVSVAIGTTCAFLVNRTDLPGRSLFEPLILAPIFISPLILSLGYIVTIGPVGIVSIAVRDLFGLSAAPWSIYTVGGIAVIAGFSHAPHVYLYCSAALRNLGSDVEDAARASGAGPWHVAVKVSLPLIWPAVVSSSVLVFFLGFEMFALPLILGDPHGLLVLTTYLFKLTSRMGVPSFQLMAVVVVALAVVTFPLVFLQRYMLRNVERYVLVRGKAAKQRPLPLGPWKWPALAGVVFWLSVAIVLPLVGITIRSFVLSWGEGVNIFSMLTLDHYREAFQNDSIRSGIFNTLLIATVGGAASVCVYAALSLATHRWNSVWARYADYIVLLPRAMPGLVAGLAFLWLFLFFKPITPLRNTLFSVWLAYTIVWVAFGQRLINSALVQIGRELEEAGSVSGASNWRVSREIRIPLIRHGLIAAWVLIFLTFVREYSTGIYLMGQGTEVIGAQMVSLWATGATDLVTAISVLNIVFIATGLGLALKFGVKIRE
ncbi:iron ABC transporter permease [Starkeya sp. ORNL1]|uniref:ABC transporter permease n=1 Tax=Starkeya sp. ORNL1 TaxID=2709380 RepID=UPI0014630CCD|nr:iron ABC transporter permease [Starkeya sp. ORNL1]QJP14580.1 iron ABC transporter permease [Starkeya sp. ORNL1]